jgi:hypothetical protein
MKKALHEVSEIEVKKLNPAKQALADAIHQNGGWHEKANYAVQSGGTLQIHFTDDSDKPTRLAVGGWRCRSEFSFFGSTSPLKSTIPNWHQTILSRDEYFTAYPEQVKTDVSSETERNGADEMKSESEITTKVSDWHKNGELPPVGEVVMLNSTSPHSYWAHHVDCELTVVAHDKDSRGVGIAVYRFVDEDGYNEYNGLVAVAFKPLRTERDKAIDEMAKLIISKSLVRISPEDATHLAGEIHDFGYRKEVN